jgi:gliding motility-associated-like protein
MQNKIFVNIILLLTLLFCGINSNASHIVGGEITYVCLGGNNYKIKISIYRDCLTGIAGAIHDDNPVYISVFDGNGVIIGSDSISFINPDGEVIPPDFHSDCLNNPPPTCLNRATAERSYYLPPNSTGYKVIYQRCCRNSSILNLVSPDATGATYTCIIPPSDVACNNSAVFKNYPPQIICVNNPLVYDHSATDPDGDSLSYEFCNAYDGGSNADPKPIPVFRYSTVTYRSPFTAARPIAGNPRIQIDPTTGQISGTPNLIGRFVVSVCCHEWRKGVMINTVTREFQFVVTNCSKAVVANIPQLSSEFNTYIVNCKDNTVNFLNTSVGGTTYHWDFGVKETDADTSDDFEPTYTYPDSGTYVVTLYVNKNTTCGDSISRFVKVYPKLRTNFTAKNFVCPGDTVQFTDQTTSTYNVNNWTWDFDDHTPFDTTQNPKHVFQYGGLYNVGYIVKNTQGCIDTAFKKIIVDPFIAFAGNDTFIVKGERIFFNAKGGGSYLWTPSTYLNNPNIGNPIGTFTDKGTFYYVVTVTSDSGCVSRDTVKIDVIENPYLSTPNAFTPNGDGVNDTFRPLAVGYQSIRFFRVFNRYGQEIFYTDSFNQGWDGTFKGQQCDLGVYYWMLGVKDRFGNNKELKGDVTLIR